MEFIARSWTTGGGRGQVCLSCCLLSSCPWIWLQHHTKIKVPLSGPYSVCLGDIISLFTTLALEVATASCYQILNVITSLTPLFLLTLMNSSVPIYYCYIFLGLSFIQDFFFFFFFVATPAAYGSSQAWDQIGAAAASLYHSHINLGSSHIWDLHHSSWQRWILNPPSKARD